MYKQTMLGVQQTGSDNRALPSRHQEDEGCGRMRWEGTESGPPEAGDAEAEAKWDSARGSVDAG